MPPGEIKSLHSHNGRSHHGSLDDLTAEEETALNTAAALSSQHASNVSLMMPSETLKALQLGDTSVDSLLSPSTVIHLVNQPTALPSPPIAKTVEHTVKLGTTGEIQYEDEYYWLRDDQKRTDSDIYKYLNDENEYAKAVIERSGISAIETRISADIARRVPTEEPPARPWRVGEYWYSYVNDSYSIQRRCSISPDDNSVPWETVLDASNIEGDMGFLEVSPCHRYIAYGVDFGGSEQYTMFIHDTKKQERLPVQFENISTNERITQAVRWSADCKSIIYVCGTEARICKRHAIENPTTLDDEILYEEQDESFGLNIDTTTDRAYLILTSQSSDANEVRYLLTKEASSKQFKILRPRAVNVEWVLEHRNGSFIIMTHSEPDCINSCIMQVSDDKVDDPSAWHLVLPARDSVLLQSLFVLAHHAVLVEMENGQKHLKVIDLHEQPVDALDFTRHVYEVPLNDVHEETIYTFFLDPPQYQSKELMMSYMSTITPRRLLQYNLEKHELITLYAGELTHFEPLLYGSERIMARSHDGALVPMTLSYKKSAREAGPCPVVLFGYGAYATAQQPWFLASRLSLFDAGFIFVTAHVRGGTEKGRGWVRAGRLEHKRNGFLDFIACAEHLIEMKISAPGKLTAWGRSAGGLLVAGSMHMRPDLFAGCVLDVPFCDIVTSLGDATVPWSTYDRREWGDPNRKEDYNRMIQYDPARNIRKDVAYPHVLVSAAWNDARVPYWEPAKLVARLRASAATVESLGESREFKPGQRRHPGTIVFLTEFDAGHYAGFSGNQIALRWAFLQWCVCRGDQPAQTVEECECE